LTYLGFITEGKLAVVLITPSLGVPNWPVIYIINTAPPSISRQVNLTISSPPATTEYLKWSINQSGLAEQTTQGKYKGQGTHPWC
jgi:hypothetical protein